MSVSSKRRSRELIQFTHRDLADMLMTGIYQVQEINLDYGGYVMLSGHTVGIDGELCQPFSIPCNPTKLFAKIGESAGEEALVTSPAPAPQRRTKPATPKEDKKVEVAPDETADKSSKSRSRRKRHPITKDLIDSSEYERVAELIRIGGPTYEVALLRTYKDTGKCNI